MDDRRKTKTQLIEELSELRQRVAALEAELEDSAAARQQPKDQHDELVTRWQLVVDTMPLGGIIIDPDSRITYWNAAAEKIFGYTAVEALGQLHYEITIPAEARATVAERLARTAQGSITTFGENENITKSGNVIVCEWHNTPLRDAAGRYVGVLSMAQDITARKQAEFQRETMLAVLRESEARYRRLVEGSPDIVYTFSSTRGGVYYSPRVEQVLGHSIEHLYAHPFLWNESIHPDDRSRIAEAVREFERGIPFDLEYRVQDVQGRWRWLHDRSIGRQVHDNEVLIEGLATDITDRKQAEEELHAANSKLETIIRVSPLAMFLLDLEGHVQLWNAAAENIFGWRADEVLGRSNPIVPVSKHDEYARLSTQVLSGSSFTNQEVVRQRKDGSLINVSVSSAPVYDPAGNLVGRMAIMADITERKRVEEALRESEERWRTVVEAEPQCVKLLDDQGKLVMMNPAGLAMLQATWEEVRGQRASDLVVEGDRASFEEMVRAVFRGESQHLVFEMIGLKGRRLILETVSVPLWDPAEKNRVKFLVGVTRDITERKRAEEQLLRAQKLESLGILAGGVAHDFNNLLVALLGQTSLAAAKLPPDHPAQRHLDRAVIAAKRAADLTRQMLTYSGHGAFQMAPLDLNILIRDNAGFLESSISKSIALRTDLAETLPFVNADAGQMQQIIMNLVLNAAEAIGDRTGSIRVATSVIDVTRDDGRWTHYTGQAVVAGRYVQLRIEDTGHGMSAETLGRIFDPFFTTKFTGRGLGLAAVLGIVRGHRGGLWVESEVGRGTTFVVILPMTAETAAASTAAPPKTPTRQIVLVIDDEEPVLEAVTDMLELDNVSTLCAKAGVEGIALFRERHMDIGLVLLDLSMPELSGREIFDQLLQVDPQARVVLSSGYAQIEATRSFEGRALVGFLQKPYNMATLLDTVRQHLARK